MVGAYLEDGVASSSGAVYIFQRDEGGASEWGEVQRLVASDAQKSDKFGSSVAVNGGSAVVGALGEDDEGSNAGAAYVLQRDEGDPGSWGEVRKLAASDAQEAMYSVRAWR